MKESTMRALFFVVGMLVATAASAQSERNQRTPLVYYLGSASTTIAGNANEAARTFSVTLDGSAAADPGRPYPTLTLFYDFTYNQATDLSTACYASNDGGTTTFQAQHCTTSAGVCTLNNASWTKSLGSSKKWAMRVDTAGFPAVMKCIVTFTNGGANDALKVSGVLSTR